MSFSFFKNDTININSAVNIEIKELSLNSHLDQSNAYQDSITRNYYSSGKIKSEGFLVNGKREGVWRFYDIVTSLEEICEYKDGVKNGLSRKFWLTEGPYVAAIGNYVNGKRDGKWERHTISRLSDKEKESFYGSLQSKSEEVTFKGGALNGPYFLKMGIIEFKGQIRNNEPIGVWIGSFNGEKSELSASNVKESGNIMIAIEEWIRE